MADIDKALPNVKQTLNIPSPEEVAVGDQEAQQDVENPIDVQQNEDGSVDINFDPMAMNPGQDEGHYANLAELLPDDVLDRLGSKLHQDYTDYKTSRKDWERAYTTGLDLLGFNYDDRSEPFKGASGATHPVLAEAVTQFQALAYKELLPSQGPIRTQIIGFVAPLTTPLNYPIKVIGDLVRYFEIYSSLLEENKELKRNLQNMVGWKVYLV